MDAQNKRFDLNGGGRSCRKQTSDVLKTKNDIHEEDARIAGKRHTPMPQYITCITLNPVLFFGHKACIPELFISRVVLCVSITLTLCETSVTHGEVLTLFDRLLWVVESTRFAKRSLADDYLLVVTDPLIDIHIC